MAMGRGSELQLFGLILAMFIIRDIITLNEVTDAVGVKPEDIVQDPPEVEDGIPDWKPEKGGPGSKISAAKFMGPTVKVMFCSSCGYQNAYDQYAQFIQEKYPEITVEGSSYPLPTFRRLSAQLLTVLKFLLLGAMLMNQWSVFRLLGLPERFIAWISENKIYAALLSFFLVNLIETQIASTGAFEIYIDDVPVWSKMQTGRLPNPPELVQIIDNHIKFGGSEGSVFQLPS